MSTRGAEGAARGAAAGAEDSTGDAAGAPLASGDAKICALHFGQRKTVCVVTLGSRILAPQEHE